MQFRTLFEKSLCASSLMHEYDRVSPGIDALYTAASILKAMHCSGDIGLTYRKANFYANPSQHSLSVSLEPFDLAPPPNFPI